MRFVVSVWNELPNDKAFEDVIPLEFNGHRLLKLGERNRIDVRFPTVTSDASASLAAQCMMPEGSPNNTFSRCRSSSRNPQVGRHQAFRPSAFFSHHAVPAPALDLRTHPACASGDRSVSRSNRYVEGAELKVLSGANKAIERFRPIVAIEIIDEQLARFGITRTRYSPSSLVANIQYSR